MLDLLITNGLVIDGTGSPGFYASVGVEGDTIRVLRGDVSEVQASKTIDAAGDVVCPGFIDVHAHSGLMILSQPEHHPKVSQGITTEIVGVDGNSYAPFRSQKDLVRFMEINSGLDGIPPLNGRWSTVEQYLDQFDRKTSVNIAYLVGNSPLRIDAIGWGNEPATKGDIANMRALIRESMQEGAVGMSTGLEYPPGNFADTDELVSLSKEVANLGGVYHTHVRYRLGDRYLDPFREAIDIGRRSGVPVHITHFYQSATSPGGAGRLLGLIEDAREKEDLDVTFDSYPYVLGSTRVLIFFPDWAHLGGPEKFCLLYTSPSPRD